MKKVSIITICLLFFNFCLSSLSSNNVKQKYFYVFFENGKYGLADENAKIVIPAKYDRINNYDTYCLCGTKNPNDEKYSSTYFVTIFNQDQNIIYTSSKPWGRYFGLNDKYVYVRNGISKGTIINCKTGETVATINDEIKLASYNCSEYYPCQNFYLCEDFETTYMKDAGYWNVYDFNDGVAVGMRESIDDAEVMYDVFDLQGKIVTQYLRCSAYSFSEGLLAVMLQDKRTGFINTKGELVFECPLWIDPEDFAPRIYPYYYKYNFSDDVVVINVDNSHLRVYDKIGNYKEVPQNIHIIERYYSNGLLPISQKVGDKFLYGYMNKNCEIVIPCKYSSAGSFKGNYALVSLDYDSGLIDTKGNFRQIK